MTVRWKKDDKGQRYYLNKKKDGQKATKGTNIVKQKTELKTVEKNYEGEGKVKNDISKKKHFCVRESGYMRGKPQLSKMDPVSPTQKQKKR